jgi:hypothetical protein
MILFRMRVLAERRAGSPRVPAVRHNRHHMQWLRHTSNGYAFEIPQARTSLELTSTLRARLVCARFRDAKCGEIERRRSLRLR